MFGSLEILCNNVYIWTLPILRSLFMTTSFTYVEKWVKLYHETTHVKQVRKHINKWHVDKLISNIIKAKFTSINKLLINLQVSTTYYLAFSYYFFRKTYVTFICRSNDQKIHYIRFYLRIKCATWARFRHFRQN